MDFLTKNHSSMIDAELSQALNRSVLSVSHKRLRLGLGSTKRAASQNVWSKKEDQFLLENLRMKLEDVMKTIGRTKAAVSHRRRLLGISVPKSEVAWKYHEILFLKKNPKMSTKEISKRLNRTQVSVMQMRRKCGLYREIHHAWSLEEKNKLKKNILLPLNDLYKLFPNRTRASINSMTRKMNRPRHRRVGYTVTPTGYVEITVNGRSVLEHVHVVEQDKHRMLKKDEIVHHIDCDKTNNDLGNLDLLQSASQHQTTHNSFRKLRKPLLDSGCIVYDFKQHRYEVGRM